MAKYLTKQFIFLRLITLASQASAKLSFNHAKGSFDVAALVILTLEPLLIVCIEVIETSLYSGMLFEKDSYVDRMNNGSLF